MATDADRSKVLDGENFIALQGNNDPAPAGEVPVTPPEATPAVTPPTPDVKTPDQILAEDAAAQAATDPAPAPAPAEVVKTPEEEADAIISELLGEAEDAVAAVKEEGDQVVKDLKDGEGDAKKTVEEYSLKLEDMTTKLAAVNKAYRNLLDEKNGLENVNEEYTRKLQIISDDPLLQDLLRGMYLKDKDPSALVNVESALKALLKEYANIDIDGLVNQARSPKGLETMQGGAMTGAGGTYEGLFDDGDVIKLAE